MLEQAIEDLRAYIASDTVDEVLVVEGMKVGRVKLGTMLVKGRVAGFNAIDILETTLEKTRRVRSGAHGTRYPAPLPLGAPPRLLTIELEDHLKHQARRGLRKETIEDTRRTLRALIVACGNIPVSRITAEHVYQTWDLLLWSSPGPMWTAYESGATCQNIIDLGVRNGVAPPSVATMEKHRRFLVTFFKKLEATGAIRISPMAGFGKLAKDLSKSTKRVDRFFEAGDLAKIFNAQPYIAWAKKAPHRWWCPILALYTGARINELAQLKLIDVVQESGRWCIAIQQTDDEEPTGDARVRSRQSLKGASAIRTIPLHPKLIAAGFLDYVDDVRATKRTARLFPHLSSGKTQAGAVKSRYSQGVVTQFSTYLKELGFDKGIGFHAFRHVFITALSQHQVSDADIALLTGHSKGGDYPVVQVYKKRQALLEAQRKWVALQHFTPAVNVPGYRKGQFAKMLSGDVKFYP